MVSKLLSISFFQTSAIGGKTVGVYIKSIQDYCVGLKLDV